MSDADYERIRRMVEQMSILATYDPGPHILEQLIQHAVDVRYEASKLLDTTRQERLAQAAADYRARYGG